MPSVPMKPGLDNPKILSGSSIRIGYLLFIDPKFQSEVDMVGWFLGITLLFIITTSFVVVAASMNSSRISQGEPLSEIPLSDYGRRAPIHQREPSPIRSVQK